MSITELGWCPLHARESSARPKIKRAPFHKFRHPRCVPKVARVECMYLSNTTLFDCRGIYSTYYKKYNYMFRHVTMAIFRLYMKYLVGSYAGLLWAVYSGTVQEVKWTRDLLCVLEGGRCGCVHLTSCTVPLYTAHNSPI